MPRSSAPQIGWEERLDPRQPNPLWGEHRARYRFAQSRAKGARVLDVACGNGYGTEMLTAAGALRVVGIDLSDDAIGFARVHYSAPSQRMFVLGTLEALPVRAGVFNLITCFETIEHVPHPTSAVRELSRVLAPGGCLFISSPNGASYQGGHSGNPFHHKEFRVEEFVHLLGPHFARVDIYGQRLARERPGVLAYSGILNEPAKGGPASVPTLRRKLFALLPYALQDLAWRLVRGEPYYPGEEEFALEADRPERFPVIVAICQRE